MFLSKKKKFFFDPSGNATSVLRDKRMMGEKKEKKTWKDRKEMFI